MQCIYWGLKANLIGWFFDKQYQLHDIYGDPLFIFLIDTKFKIQDTRYKIQDSPKY